MHTVVLWQLAAPPLWSNETKVPPGAVLKPVPVIVTTVPLVPLDGETLVIVGKTRNVYEVGEGAEVTPLTVAVSLTDPAACAGLDTKQPVPPLEQSSPDTTVPPKLTVVAFVRLVPEIVRLVAPVVGPWMGVKLVMDRPW